MSRPVFTNHLINEKSPYLLQHAHNPVNWYPWGEEAFKLAKDQEKPIFLSIGYATCHWCHVMEQESFQNTELAKSMNETFINIKVDREEKPEVDSLYMEFAQAMMSGGAGWPLNVILTPDLMPFFAATYLPADTTRGFLGMKQLTERIGEIWLDPEEKENVIMQAGKIVDVFATHVHTSGEALPSLDQIKEAAELLFKTADPIYGGTKGAPKFPVGIQAFFLLRLARSNADSRALFYVERTLDMMHRGGIYDHIGGGFSRYTVDEHWLLPHFEKMLYDNAILARAYFEAWEYTRHPFYREVAEEILGYLLREMRDPQGAFYSAEDADSEGHEGKFYTWTQSEIQSALNVGSPLFCDLYGVTAAGNFQGRNVLHLRTSIEEYAAHHRLEPSLLKNSIKDLRYKLFKVREQRKRPLKDDKILTAWNGLAIYACAVAGRLFNQPMYLEAAEEAAQFIRTHLWKEGSLLRRWRDGEAKFDACLDDYAFLIHGLLSLFEADRGTEWLEFALRLTRELERSFKAEKGAFYLTNGGDPNLILRRCEFYDGAEPSGNGVHTENLIRLYQFTGVESFLFQAEDILKAAKEHIDLYPPGACYHLMALERFYDQNAPTLIIALNEEESYREEIIKMLAGHFIPHQAVIWSRDSDEDLRDLAPICRNKQPIKGQTTLYICYRDRCDEPIHELPKMWEAIEKL